MFGIEIAPEDITNGIAATGSAGFLFLIARWLWHYEQIITNRYEIELKSNTIRIEALEKELEKETSARQHAQEVQARMMRVLVTNGIDPNDPEILKLWQYNKDRE